MNKKILILDIETSFRIAAVWGRWKQTINMPQIIQDNYILSYVAKWAGSDELIVDALHYYPKHYKKDPTCDKKIMESMWQLLDEADAIVAHNGNSFDIKKLNTAFLKHKMPPPSPYHKIDTFLIAKRLFNLTSNRLDDLGQFLGVGGKMEHEGLELWKSVVLKHDLKAFDRMVDYNERDVELLEDVYNALKPWDSRHPAVVGLTDPGKPLCNVCGSDKVTKDGSYSTLTGRIYQRYLCKAKGCGHRMRAAKVDPVPKHKQQQLRSV